jgi:HEAT repeat protein
LTIHASSARQIQALISDLSSDRAVVREAAIARLSIIGIRAVERLTTVALDSGSSPTSRISALRALEGIHDARAVDAAARLVADNDAGVAAAAIAALRPRLGDQHGVKLMDRIAAVATDSSRPEQVREAALQVLGDLRSRTIAPLLTALERDPSQGIRTLASRLKAGDRPEAEDSAAVIAAAAAGTLPDNPDTLRRAVVESAAAVPVTVLRQLVDVLREQETASGATKRMVWSQVRAVVHAALANRKSRLALFDLRETLEKSDGPLPVEFVAALMAIGDGTCLEPVAAAFDRSIKSGRRNTWWLRHLADAFETITERERLSGRHGVMKRIQRRWPSTYERLRNTLRTQ